MENQEPKTGKFALNYGLIAGGIGIVFSLMIFFMDMLYDPNQLKNWIPTIILIVVIVLAVIAFKKANDGLLNISQGLKVSVGVALVAAILGIIYLILLVNVLEPDFAEKNAEATRALMTTTYPELTSEQIDQNIEMQNKFFWIAYPFILIINCLVGLVVGLIVSLIMKKERPAY